MKAVVIDNYDSFTYNLVQYLGELGCQVEVYRNDAVTLEELRALDPACIVISPGPGVPSAAGISVDLVREFAGSIPILGVCLGHQAVAEAFGGRIVPAPRLMHGKTSAIHHDGKGLLDGVPSPFTATRYHSLAVAPDEVPAVLELSAWTEGGEVMALRHEKHPVFGLQFHPESIMTEDGKRILDNFLNLAAEFRQLARPRLEGAEEEEPQLITAEELQEYTREVIQGRDLTQREAEQCLELVLSRDFSETPIASFLTAMTMKGETSAEIAGFARVMRRHAVQLTCDHPRFIDTAGTGGGPDTFNISTAAAFVIAGAGVPVAKHGNRAVTSRSGSADVLSALGVKIDQPPQVSQQALNEVGLCFMFAPLFHPAMKKVAGVRGELGHRTIFNVLGPLTNPAGAPCQIIGVFLPELTRKMAEALARLGCERAWIVHSNDGLDELSTGAKIQVCDVRKGRVERFTLDPERLGFAPSSASAYPGGDPEENAATIRGILEGRTHGAARNVVVLNAAAALYVAGEGDWPKAIARASESIDSGAAAEKLARLVEVYKGVRDGGRA